jgi:hypothetical protein
MNLKQLTLLASLSLMSMNSFAGLLREGGFEGTSSSKGCVNILLKKAPGREGSFFAVLMKNEKKISLYMVDEINASSYSMTPLEVTTDGEIGVINDNPSLVISSAKNSKGADIFKIMSSNSGNDVGFTGYMEFDGKKSDFNWVQMDSGEFKKDTFSNDLQISQVDITEREATAVFLTKTINGTFTLREKFPGMYLINQNSVLATGVKKSQIPRAIGIFLESKGIFGGKKSEMILINPKNDTDLTTFTKK